jgi:hypothetical protein
MSDTKEKITRRDREHALFIAKSCKSRMETQRLSGTTRDRATLEFWCGASAAIDYPDAERPMASWFRMLTMLVSVRGYSEVDEVIRNLQQKLAEEDALDPA